MNKFKVGDKAIVDDENKDEVIILEVYCDDGFVVTYKADYTPKKPGVSYIEMGEVDLLSFEEWEKKYGNKELKSPTRILAEELWLIRHNFPYMEVDEIESRLNEIKTHIKE